MMRFGNDYMWPKWSIWQVEDGNSLSCRDAGVGKVERHSHSYCFPHILLWLQGGKAYSFDVETHSPSFMILLEMRKLETNLTNIGQAKGESSRGTGVTRNNRQEYFTEKKEKKIRITTRSQNFNRGRSVTSRSQSQNNDRRNDNRPDLNSEGQTSTQSDDLRCSRCKKYHPNRPCRAGLGVCYKCGKPEHLSRNCPHKKRWDVAKFDSQT
ncbi:hypothetical protein Ahy_A04g019368 [Arachis hypogaea]|uniref:CCHC-type domain-containing protein n=1 Tax=Arachis hypogaea TaxID=3818 RepID=A0A445DFU7_ARAHY|nr:hypothetical protein Ahy_A04g019368 [Arachis hypogaea]